MKRVLYVTNIPAPYKVEFLSLLGRQTELTVIFERDRAENRDQKWSAGAGEKPYHELCLNGRPFGEEFSISLGLTRHLRKNRYDTVVFGGYNSPTLILAMEWMRRHRRAYAIACDGMLPKQGSCSGWKERLKRSLISHADFCIGSGETTGRELCGYGARTDRVFSIPFSSVREAELTKELPDRNACKQKLNCCGKTVFLYVGQFIRRKGLDLLVPAFEDFCRSHPEREAVLFLVGGRREQLEALGLTSLPKNVRCVSFLTKQELLPYYQAADLFVLPTREDIWGLVVNEAMAYGLPVLTTDRCGAGLELIQPGSTGILVPTENRQALTRGLEDGLSLTDRELVRQSVSRYTIEQMAREFLRILSRNDLGAHRHGV